MINYLRILVFYSTFFYGISIKSQNFYFPFNDNKDSIQLNMNIQKVSKELLEVYGKSNWGTLVYYDNLFKNQFICGDYANSIKTLESLRKFMGKSDSISVKGVGFQYQVLAATRILQSETNSDFNTAYTTTFKKLYNLLPYKAMANASSYFNSKLSEVEKSFKEILGKSKDKDSIEYENAVLLCRSYASFLVYSQSLEIGKSLLFKIESKDYIIQDSIIVKTRDSADISITLVRKTDVKEKLPTIFIFSIYPNVSNMSDARKAADNGYVGVVANVRGKRLSNSAIEPFEHDANDTYDIIDWICKQAWSNGKVGMYGGSYLGFTQWATLKKIHPALKTIVPIASIAPAIDFGMVNGIFEANSVKFINYVTNNKYTDDNSFRSNWYMKSVRWYTSGIAFNRFDSLESKPMAIFQKWLKHPTYDSYWQHMIPYKKDFAKINIPILSITGYFDGDQTGALYYFKEHQKYNKNPNHYLVIGPYDHYAAQGTSSASIGNYKIDSIANININELVYKWYDYILKDSAKPSILKDKINYEVMDGNRWEHKPNLKLINNDTLQYYFSNDTIGRFKKLIDKKSKQIAYNLDEINFKDREDSIPKFWTNYIDTILFKAHSTFYVSEPIKDELTINGQFIGELKISVNKKDVDLFVNLYEQRPDGKYMYLSNIIFRASLIKDKTKRQLLKPNVIEHIPINGGTFISKQLHKGSRIIIALGVNKDPQYEINYGTGKDVSAESIKDAGEPLKIKWYNDSYIQIPVWREKK
jgi:uncharacterized protein